MRISSVGMFDTYYIQWGDSAEGLQTKQLSCLCSTWSIGERVPLRGLGGSDYGNDADQRLIPDGASPFRSLVEDWTVGSFWHNANLCDRFFTLGHSRGKFADYASFKEEQMARAHAIDLAALWNDQAFGVPLRARFDLITERNAAAWSSLEQAKGSLNDNFARWCASEHEKKTQKIVKTEKTAWNMTKLYFGADFAGVGRLEVHEAYAHLTSDWRHDCLDFEAAINPKAASNRSQEVALEAASRHRAFSAHSSALGAPSVGELGSMAECFMASKNPGPKECLDLLRLGHWGLFEELAGAHVEDKKFVGATKKFLERLCVSRVGSSWALGLMAIHPKLLIQSVSAGGIEHGLVEWAAVGLGLPSHQILPLIELGSPCSPTLAHHCLGKSHGALMQTVVASLGGLSRVDDLDGVALAEQAVRCHSLQALRTIEEEQGLPPMASQGRSLIDLAFEVDATAARMGFPSVPETIEIDSLPTALGCAAFLIELGHQASPQAPRSERLAAYLRLREKHDINDSTLPGPEKQAGPRL